MERNDYGKAYSSDVYASKNEVAKDLPFRQGIEVFWQKILEYRELYADKLTLRNVERLPFTLCLTQGILRKSNNLERKLIKLLLNYNKLSFNNFTKVNFRNNALMTSLKHVANIYQINADEGLLLSIINENELPLNPNQIVLKNYYNCLKDLEHFAFDPLNKVRLLKYVSLLSGINNESDLYRQEEIQDRSLMLYDRLYVAAPLERINDMLSDLLTFVNDEKYSPLIRSVLAYFYLIMVQPFSFYDEEAAIIFMKAILANNDFGELAALLDFENLIDENKEKMSAVFKEVLNSNDITYVLYHVLDILEDKVTDMLNQLSDLEADEIHNEFFNVKQNQEEVTATKEAVEKPREILHNVDYEVRVALPKLPVGLDEKDAPRIAEHLLELNPNLKKGEAMFYAYHCTVGKYYTIQQFKAMNDCAYETARTSMDNLAKLGYYQKEMIKNKFVYTPVQRK